jgi:hypothetical protein
MADPENGGAGALRVRREGADPTWWTALGPVGVVKLLVLGGLLAWLYWEHFYRLYRYWQQPDWSHGFLVPPFCLYMLNTKRRKLLTGQHRGSLVGAALMILSVVVYAKSVQLKITYPQPLSIVSMLDSGCG